MKLNLFILLLLWIVKGSVKVFGFKGTRIVLSKFRFWMLPLKKTIHRNKNRLVRNISGSKLNVTCLHRSLAIAAVLDWLRIPNEIKVGVKKEAGVLMAHAWCESDSIQLYSDPKDYFVLHQSIDPLVH